MPRSKTTSSFDHLVRAGKHHRRNFHTERSRSVEVYNELELGRLENRQVDRLGALEEARGIGPDLTKGVEDIGAVAHQPASFGIGARRVDGRQRVTRRQHSKLDAPRIEERAWGDEKSVGLLVCDTRKRLIDFAAGGNLANENLLPTDSRLYLP